MEFFDSLPGWIKWLVGLLGVLGVGVLTNALWELLVRPASFSLARWISGVASLGLKSLQDSLYRNVARNPAEMMIQECYGLVISGFAGLFIMATLGYYVLRPSLDEHTKLPKLSPAEYQELLDSTASRDSASLSIVERRTLSTFLAEYAKGHERLEDHARKIIRVADYLYPFLLVLGVWMMLGAARLSLARQLNERYRRKLALLRPVLTDDEVHLLNADFAAVKRAEDYRRLIDRLAALDTERLAHLK